MFLRSKNEIELNLKLDKKERAGSENRRMILNLAAPVGNYLRSLFLFFHLLSVFFLLTVAAEFFLAENRIDFLARNWIKAAAM